MSHTGKLYQHYLKKTLWRSWRVWGAIALCWIWWIGYSWLAAATFRQSIRGTHIFSEEGVWIDQEFSWKGNLEKSYQGALLFDEEAAQWWEEHASQAQEPKKYQAFAKLLRKGRIVNLATVGAEELTKEEKWKAKYLDHNSPCYWALTEFSSRQEKLDRGGWGKKIALVHHLSLWNVSGFIMGMFLAYSLLDSLFVEARKNGEDAMVLNLTPGVERSHLFIGKTLALLSNLATYTFLGFIVPYTIILLAFGPGITSWGTYLLLVFWTTFVGSVLFFLFPAALYLFATNLGMVGKIIQLIIHYFSTLWLFLNMGARATRLSAATKEEKGGSFFAMVAKIEYYYYHPLTHIAFAVILGGLSLAFYYSYYQQEDLS